ncbi:MAG: hypothetical protein ACM33T_11600 [Solirubrobacterales bacterium]
MRRLPLLLALSIPAAAHAETYAWDVAPTEGPDRPLVVALAVRPMAPAQEPAAFAEQDRGRAGAVLDWYPGLGGLRVTGGFTPRPGDTPRLTASQPGHGKLLPYLGIGWQGSAGQVLIGLDLGALYDGRPDVRLGAAPSAAMPDLPGAFGDGKREFLPTISLTFTMRF